MQIVSFRLNIFSMRNEAIVEWDFRESIEWCGEGDYDPNLLVTRVLEVQLRRL